MKYVQLVRGRWIVRVTVPEDVRDIIGVRKLVEKDLPLDARKRERYAIGVINRFHAQIDEAREVKASRATSPDVTLVTVAKSHYGRMLTADNEMRASFPSAVEIEAEKERAVAQLIEDQRANTATSISLINAETDYQLKVSARSFDQDRRRRRLAALRAHFQAGDTRWIEERVNHYISEMKLSVQPGSKEWVAIAEALMRVEIRFRSNLPCR